MAEMGERDLQAFKYFLGLWKSQWDLNQYYRDWYNEDLEFYRGYRDPNKYPMLYNLSFNKLLPRVFTVLSRFMSQLYQSGDFVSVKPRKRSDVERATRVRGLLDYQLETLNDCDAHGGSWYFNFKWMFNALTFGKGICKMYWKKEEQIGPVRMVVPVPKQDQYGRVVGMQMMDFTIQQPQVTYDGPYAEVIHNKLFNPHPHYKDIQKMPMVGCLYSRSIDYIKRKVDEGVWRNIDKLGWSAIAPVSSGSSGYDSGEAFAKSLALEGAMQAELTSHEQRGRSGDVDILEMYGKYIFPEDDAPYEVGSGVKIKGKESEAVVHIGNYKTLLGLEKWTYQRRPFFDIGCYHHPELFWDIGIIRLGKDLQEQYNNMGNLRHQNVMQLINQMLQVRQDADIDPAALVWKPFGIIPVEAIGTDVAPLETPDAFQSGAFREQEQFFESAISDMTGMYPYNMGATPERQENVGTIYSIQSMGEARTKLLMMGMDHMGFRPFLKYMMILNTYHFDLKNEARINTNEGQEFVPLFPGDMHPGYDFSARYTAMEPALGKQFRAQQLIQYAQMWAQSPYTQHYQFQKAILEMLDFHDADRYLKTPQQVSQEQMAAKQEAMQAEIMGAKIQDELTANQQKRELERDVVKGMMA